jgi:hypothetical protein
MVVQAFRLVLVNTDRAGTAFELGHQTQVERAPDNEMILDHPSVSGHHLVVKRERDRFRVQDLGSLRGTLLDGQAIREGHLHPGTLLTAGEVQLRFSPTLEPVDIAPTREDRLGELVGQSLPMRQIFALLQRIAPSESTVLLIGLPLAGEDLPARVDALPIPLVALPVPMEGLPTAMDALSIPLIALPVPMDGLPVPLVALPGRMIALRLARARCLHG